MGERERPAFGLSRTAMIGFFEREARWRLSFFAALIGVALLTTIIAPKLIRFWRVDTCLDHGGRYNYAEGRCELHEDTSRQQ
jgi:hypothetical protein